MKTELGGILLSSLVWQTSQAVFDREHTSSFLEQRQPGFNVSENKIKKTALGED